MDTPKIKISRDFVFFLQCKTQLHMYNEIFDLFGCDEFSLNKTNLSLCLIFHLHDTIDLFYSIASYIKDNKQRTKCRKQIKKIYYESFKKEREIYSSVGEEFLNSLLDSAKKTKKETLSGISKKEMDGILEYLYELLRNNSVVYYNALCKIFDEYDMDDALKRAYSAYLSWD